MSPRALGDSVRPRRLVGASGRPLNFTVRPLLGAQCMDGIFWVGVIFGQS